MSGLQAVKLAGGIMPPALLGRIQAGEVAKASLAPVSYHLAAHETVRDAAARSWSYLRGAYTAWREADAARQPGSSGTGLTRDRWLLPLLRELGYGTVPALTHGRDIEGTHYPISHAREHIPAHLLGPDAALDRRNPGMTGAARAPQAMVQEYLNRSEDHLWAVLSNGLRLRLLRDSTSLAGSAYIEFDLEAIFTGELYAEFLLLFQVAHQSRLEKRAGVDGSPADCWMEDWRAESVAAGTRALDKLRDGVEAAIGALGTGFLRHPDNRWLVVALRDGRLSTTDYHRALLRLVYRLLFTFVAEDRDALLDPAATPEARTRYANYFSTARLRRLSNVRRGGPHPDLWQGQRLILAALGGDGLPQLGIPPLGGLFDPDPRAVEVPDQPHRDLLHGAEVANLDLLAAIRALAWVSFTGERRQAVDYAHLGAEELGSVYESLLELIPRIDLDTQTFTLQRLAGNERKTTGSYYTPPALVSALLDTALDPVLDQAIKGATTAAEAEERLLAVTVCDPASGSGGFLVAAARRIARRLAQLRAGEDEPTPDAVQHALRDVIGRCIYGVDLNDLAAELAKVSLWLEALEPGKPLGFLDARIRVGNSLIGTTPALLAAGVPDDAFEEITGDDKAWASTVRRKNKAERSGQAGLFDLAGEVADVHALAQERAVVLAPADHIRRTRAQAAAWEAYEHSDALRRARLHADAWTAAFVWPLRPAAPPPPTTDVLAAIAANPDNPALAATVAEVQRLAAEYRFFHWHLEFPEVMSDERQSGFTCMLGNPPWNRVKLQEAAYFKQYAPEVADAPNASKRKKMVADLATTDPTLHVQYLADLRRAEATSHFLGQSDRYPLGGVGDINTYPVFADLMRQSIAPTGRLGVILPTGIVSGFTYRAFVQHLLRTRTLVSYLGFENEDLLFPDITNKNKFGLLTVSGLAAPVEQAVFVANARQPEQLLDPERRYRLTAAEIEAINPNSLTVPAFRWARDAEVTAAIHSAAPVLVNHETGENPWGVQFLRMFDMANDSGLFLFHDDVAPHIVAREGACAILDDGRRVYPLYEGKMLWQYDHRYGTYEGQTQKQANKGVLPHVDDVHHDDPDYRIQPRYWVEAKHVDASGWWSDRPWSLAFRDLGTAERTMLATPLPASAANHKTPLLRYQFPDGLAGALVSLLGSLCVDYSLRQRAQGMSFFVVEQAPVLPPPSLATPSDWLGGPALAWLSRRAGELAYTSSEQFAFARDCGLDSPPFRWIPERRADIQAEIDAAVLHLYALDRTKAEWLIDSFTVLRKYEERDHGEFRTKRLVLGYYDLMQTAIDTGVTYSSPIDPPPGHGPRHPARKEMT